MYDLFRFIMVRPAQDVPEIDALSIQATTQFQGDVAKGLAGPHADRRVGELVTAFERSADFVSDPSDLSLAKPLLGLAEHLASIRRPNAEALLQTVRDLLGVELNELVANQQFKDQSTQLFDSLVAIKLDKDAQTGGVSQLVDVARMFALLARASTGDSFADAHAIERALSLPLLLPAQIFPVRKALGEPSHAGSVEAQQDGEAAPPHEPTNHERLARVEDALSGSPSGGPGTKPAPA